MTNQTTTQIEIEKIDEGLYTIDMVVFSGEGRPTYGKTAKAGTFQSAMRKARSLAKKAGAGRIAFDDGSNETIYFEA